MQLCVKDTEEIERVRECLCMCESVPICELCMVNTFLICPNGCLLAHELTSTSLNHLQADICYY